MKEGQEVHSRRSSLMFAFDSNFSQGNGASTEGVRDDDDSFVFTDQMHQNQEFELIFGEVGDISQSETKVGIAEDTPLLDQSKIVAYGQKKMLLEVLEEVDKIQMTTRKAKGFKEWKFAFGLVNCLLIAYMFGSHPEHFWILYAIETVFWMSYKFKGMYYAKPLSEALYYLDFCWVMNALGALFIPTMIVLDSVTNHDLIPVEVRKTIFLACFGVFCGPVFLAAMVLPFVAFLFHDVNTTANLIIHLMPSMVMYNFRWHSVAINSAYPTSFPHLKEYMEDINQNATTVDLARITFTVYFGWFTAYGIWMLFVGLKLPVISKDKSKPPPKYDTVFHSTWQGGMCELAGTSVWRRPKEVSRDCSERNDYEVRDFLLYMTGHALGSCVIGISIVGNFLCFHCGQMVHAALIWLATILCAKRGADRYTYYVTSMYGQKLRQAFQEIKDRRLSEQLKASGVPFSSIVEESEKN